MKPRKVKIGREVRLPSLDAPDSHEHTTTRHTETMAAESPDPPPDAAHAVLVVVNGVDAGRVIAIDRREVTIGRAPECDAPLSDYGVSHRHARVYLEGEEPHDGAVDNPEFMLEDLESKNGTFLDGAPVKEPRRLHFGESFRVGPEVTMRLMLMTPAEEKATRQLHASSVRDSLTGAFNSRYFAQRLKSEIAFGARHLAPLSVAVFNVDNLKALNAKHGHASGNAVLEAIVKAVNRLLRSEDVLARLGGDEFGIILRGVNRAGALACAERIRVAVESERMPIEPSAPVTISVGVATSSESPRAEQRLVELASGRMRTAKSNGRNIVTGPE